MKKLSILIPAYNADKYLKDCLDSILGQDGMNNDIEGVNKFNFDASDRRTSKTPDFWRGCKIAK